MVGRSREITEVRSDGISSNIAPNFRLFLSVNNAGAVCIKFHVRQAGKTGPLLMLVMRGDSSTLESVCRRQREVFAVLSTFLDFLAPSIIFVNVHIKENCVRRYVVVSALLL